MDDSITFRDGAVGSAPIVLPRILYERIEQLAARAGLTAVELIELTLSDLFDDPATSLEALANIIRELPPDTGSASEPKIE